MPRMPRTKEQSAESPDQHEIYLAKLWLQETVAQFLKFPSGDQFTKLKTMMFL